MYGTYDYGLTLEKETIKLNVEKRGDLFIYRREAQSGISEKILGPNKNRIMIHPIEPLTKPKQVTRFLEFAIDPIFLDPESKKSIFLKFPIEIGVFVVSEMTTEVLDTFSLNTAKYSLYGTPRSGVITRWSKSKIFSGIPEMNPLREGVVYLTIHNSTREFVEVSKIVLDGSKMILYFGDFVGTKVKMNIISLQVAETSCIDEPLEKGMIKALDLFKAKGLPVIGKYEIKGIGDVELRVFLMEWGLK